MLLSEKEFRRHFEEMRHSTNIKSERKRKTSTDANTKSFQNREVYQKYETEDFRNIREKRVRVSETKNKESHANDIHKFGLNSQRMSKACLVDEV